MKEQSGYLSRQKNFIFPLLIFCLVSFPAAGQIFPSPIGAKSWGIANATVARSDYSSGFNNVAGLGGLNEAIAFTSYDSHYGFDGLNTLSFGVVLPLSEDLSTAFSVQRFGDKLYNEFAMSFGVGHKIGRVSLGIKANYLQNSVNAPSLIFSRKAFVIEFGGIVQFSSNFSFGAHVFNMTQSSFSGDYGGKVPTSIRAGFVYSPIKTLFLSAEADKNTDLPISIKAGLEYNVWKYIYLRTGLASKPLTNHFGAGIKSTKFYMDYAVHTHPRLGMSHHLSLAYKLWRTKTED